MKIIDHFCTITRHRFEVLLGCFQVGLYRQGLVHDLSKYMPDEFCVGVKYYQGNRSPNVAQREDIGYSTAWMHHKGRNKHHYEYWSDFDRATLKMRPAPMPIRYVVEMLMDRIAACKVYEKENYTPASPLGYYTRSLDKSLMHERTKRQLEYMMYMLSQKGEKETFAYIRKHILHNDNKLNQCIANLMDSLIRLSRR